MLEIAIMLEGQNGLNWARWQQIAATVEAAGFAGLYRSDHYTNAEPPDQDSLELWVSPTWLASHTQRIEFGPLVSPVSFRQPTLTARMAAAVDDLSGGRLTLGLGAGWQAREHKNYSWELLKTPARFERFEEGLKIINHLLKKDEPLYFEGKFYQISEGVLLPRPSRPGGPPILIGGNGPQRTLPLVARYAQEWNAVYIPPAEIRIRNQQLDQLLQQENRRPEDLRRSLMTGCVFGVTQEEVDQKVAARTRGKRTAKELIAHGLVVGTSNEIVAQLKAIEQAGIQRVMLQWLNLEDLAGLEALAQGVLPQLQ